MIDEYNDDSGILLYFQCDEHSFKTNLQYFFSSMCYLEHTRVTSNVFIIHSKSSVTDLSK